MKYSLEIILIILIFIYLKKIIIIQINSLCYYYARLLHNYTREINYVIIVE